MPGLVPGIHVFALLKGVDGRVKPGHDREAASAPRHRLQAFEGQALGIFHAGEVEPADKGCDRIAVAVGQCMRFSAK